MRTAPAPSGGAADAEMTTSHLPIDDLVETLRRSWIHVAGEVTGTPDLGMWLDQRIDDLGAAGRLDREALITVLDEITAAVHEAGRMDLDAELGRGLLRAVYEFLLGVDARRERVARGLPAVEAAEPPVMGIAGTGDVESLSPAPVTPSEVEAPVPPAPAAQPARRSSPVWDPPATTADQPGPGPAMVVPPPPPPPMTTATADSDTPVRDGAQVLRLPAPPPAAVPTPPDRATFPTRPGRPEPTPGGDASAHATSGGVAAATLSAEIDRLLGAGRYADVPSLLARTWGEGGITGFVGVAMAAGDRCRDDGQARAASDCYVAAWNADRLDEAALWRLAELAMAGHDVELTVSYLDRLAAVLQWRGDVRGAARVYRKMSILAPDREDLRDLLRRTETVSVESR